ncbi:cytochrome P450 78A3-like [Phoenix dactylifera]|uniref:Cytochrome P450 78A3-like n=1 Tax=Phoenix dactylifera TaxID=42345 RepID=A0A8B7C564_PHODC|nr:cytochrome P450 78A3-like [Phoenix dactylifera]
METCVESWWILPLTLAPNILGCLSRSSSPPSIALAFSSIVVLAILVWLANCLLHWAFPGGPAWGKYYWWRKTNSSTSSTMIPGPRGLPFLGSMDLMSGLAHRHLAAAATCLGAKRLMAFSIGETRAIVASHPDVAKEILNSPAFADRPPTESAYGLMFHRSIGFAPHGTYWRNLRRIAATHLFSPKQVNASAPHRSHIADQMTAALRNSTNGDVQVRRILRRASLCYIMQFVFGKQFELCSASEETEGLLCMVEEGYDLLGKNNWSDHFPLLAGLDIQKIRSRCSKLVTKAYSFVYPIIEEHRATVTGGRTTAPDFVDILISLQEPEGLSDSDMVAILWEMIFRGTDAMAVLMEWTLARVVLHPGIQAKVHQELDHVVGTSRRRVVESDALRLVYLQALLKEVLRMHPPGPLLSWSRLAISETLVDGHLVPAGTTAMVNMWAICRDPDVWKYPLEFRPERFLNKDGDMEVEFSVMGTDLRLAPFGSGRRSCPGKGLAMMTVSFWMASLLHDFEWLPSEVKGVDLSEVLRLSSEMAAPLEVRVQPRRHE